jgi:transposase-like protein
MVLREEIMASIEIKCPSCGSTRIIKYRSYKGKQRYAGKHEACERNISQLDYTYTGCKPDIDRHIIAMAVNAPEIRDTLRVLGISTGNVVDVFKKSLEHNQNKSRVLLAG